MNLFDYYCDQHLHIYEVASSPYQSPILPENTTFGPKSYPIHIVDQFGGKRPLLFNLEYLRSGKYDLQLVVTIVLDSHIASELHSYRVRCQSMKKDRRQAIEEFLSFVSSNHFDYTPIFYFIESYCKSDPKVFIDTVAPVATSILYLKSMDEKRFVESKEIILNPDALNHYFSEFNAGSLENCGKALIEQVINDKLSYFVKMINASYACLLKMTLIHKKNNKPIKRKIDEFENFMEAELCLYMAREILLAAYYFAELSGSFIGVQAGMNFEKAKRSLRATAWDIFLLRLPELLLNPQNLPEMNLAYICTAEKKLAELGGLFTVERLYTRSDGRAELFPTVSMNLSLLERKLGQDVITSLKADNDERIIQRISHKPIKSPNDEKIRYLIEDLEIQLSYLCKR